MDNCLFRLLIPDATAVQAEILGKIFCKVSYIKLFFASKLLEGGRDEVKKILISACSRRIRKMRRVYRLTNRFLPYFLIDPLRLPGCCFVLLGFLQYKLTGISSRLSQILTIVVDVTSLIVRVGILWRYPSPASLTLRFPMCVALENHLFSIVSPSPANS